MMSRFMCDAPLCSPILSGHINRFALSGSPMDTYHIFVRAYQSEVTTQVSSGRHLREPEGSRGSHLPTSSTIACAMGRRKLVEDLACSLFRAAKSQPLAKNTLSGNRRDARLHEGHRRCRYTTNPGLRHPKHRRWRNYDHHPGGDDGEAALHSLKRRHVHTSNPG